MEQFKTGGYCNKCLNPTNECDCLKKDLERIFKQTKEMDTKEEYRQIDRNIAEELWTLLDSIDTLSDICKPTEADPKAAMAFYSNAMRYAAKRFDFMKSDGYKLYTIEEFGALPGPDSGYAEYPVEFVAPDEPFMEKISPDWRGDPDDELRWKGW